MAKLWSNQVRVYFEGYDVGTATTQCNVTKEYNTQEITSMGDSAEQFLMGLRTDSFTWSGLFDDDNSMDEASNAVIGSADSMICVALGTATGNRAFAGTGLHNTIDVPASHDQLVQITAGFQPNQAWDASLHYGVRGTLASDGTSGSIDNGTESTNGGNWYLHLFNTPTGTAGTSRISFRHSTDAVVWANVGSAEVNPGSTAVSSTWARKPTSGFTMPSTLPSRAEA